MRNFLGMNLFLVHIIKHLGFTGTPIKVQDSSIKLSGFGVDIKQTSSAPETKRNLFYRQKFFNDKFCFEGF